MDTKQPKRISGKLLSPVAGVAYSGLALLGVASFIWILIRPTEPSASIFFSLGWYWFVGAGIAFFIARAWIWQFSPQREREREREQRAEEKKQEAEKEQKQFMQTCSSWFWAFKNGTVSEYPTTDPIKHGLIMRQDEVCYLAAPGAVLGRCNAHQLEISEGADAGVDLKALRLGGKKDRKDSYSTIVYDEAHPGTLLITSQRITFVSPPSVFLDIAPSQIVTAAWSGTYVLLRTTMTPDENKNLLAFSLTNRGPAWLYVSAILRLAEDHAGDPKPSPVVGERHTRIK